MKYLLPAVALLAGMAAATGRAQDGGAEADAPWDLLDSHCAGCHNSEDWAGGLSFDLLDPAAIDEHPDVWEAAVRKLRGRLMPPPGSEQPAIERLDALVGWLESELDAGAALPRAGHVPVQRLNRNQYARAVADLLAVDIDPAQYLPREIDVEGFDNIAAALSVSPAFLDQYIDAARDVARLAVGEARPPVSMTYLPVPAVGDQDGHQDGLPPGTRGGMRVRHHFPADGEYRFTILDLDVGLYPRAIETRQTLVLLVNGREVFREQIGGAQDLALVNKGGAPARAELMRRFADIPVQVKAGTHEVAVTFIERSRAATDETIGGFVAYGGFDFQGALRVPRVLDGIEIRGPHAPQGVSSTPSREKIFSCHPDRGDEARACAERIIARLGRRAFRRPLRPGDLDDLMPFYEAGRRQAGGFDSGIREAVTAILVSPDFLYRGISPRRDIGEDPYFALSDLELASRLSFFLWSSLPDEELLALAEQGRLREPSVLDAQVRRMLADPRAGRLVTDFALKWLDLDDLAAVEPDPGHFPAFTEGLRRDFTGEITRFLDSILLSDRSMLDLLNAEHSFLNQRLARHYGIADVHGSQFRRVKLADERRHGLLGKAAVLMRTSYGDRTSPVLRGAWVLEKLMGTPPAPPPPDVETDLSEPDGERPATVRARLEQHRASPGCNQCHGVIDPLGLALENYTVTGQWRDEDRRAGQPIDASAVLPGGAAVDGPVALRGELMRRPEQFVQAFTEKLLMFALGRELEYFDMPQVRAVVRDAADEDYRFSAIVQGIVRSDAFRWQRRAAPAEDAGLARRPPRDAPLGLFPITSVRDP